MARDPGSKWSPLPESGDQGTYAKSQLIVHSTGTTASAKANFGYFSSHSVAVESTFIIGYGPEDPTLQILDSNERADANGDANRRGISIEVVGTGTESFTAWQMSEIIRIGKWAHKTHKVPLRVIPTEDEGGYGWHVMFGAPGPWTSVRGKVCPGTKRITQLQKIIFPAIFATTTAKPEPKKETHAMTIMYQDATSATQFINVGGHEVPMQPEEFAAASGKVPHLGRLSDAARARLRRGDALADHNRLQNDAIGTRLSETNAMLKGVLGLISALKDGEELDVDKLFDGIQEAARQGTEQAIINTRTNMDALTEEK